MFFKMFSDNESENDLPLVSNIKDILVSHYVFNFSCDFEKCFFNCSVVLFLEPVMTNAKTYCKCLCDSAGTINDSKSTSTGKSSERKLFMMILDCHNILIHYVEEVFLNSSKEYVKYNKFNSSLLKSGNKMKFLMEKWSLKIWKDDCFCKFCFPSVIRIFYSTIPEGLSLLWVKDQDKNPAVFTYGAWVNNRSLFPCQEPPSAMATWEGMVDVQNPAVALMSGDEDASTHFENGRTFFYYFTKNVLPLSTLCLAVGFWQEHAVVSRIRSGVKFRIFSPLSLMDKSVQELFEYAPYCLQISEAILGTYPFPRIDFLIVPPTFGSLGMASPNIVFLSQSLLTGDSSMSSRIAHEIAHGWFGLLIGALDWTEEWLSEGFATFVEDYLHVETLNMPANEAKDYIEVKTYIRLKTLLQEISNSDEELQVLSGKTVTQEVDGVNVPILKNGQNPIKAFIQVHYIKGYFLLKHLSETVGSNNFMLFLKGYIEIYRGKLVTSMEFLEEFFKWFPNIGEKLNIEKINEDWLHNPDIVPELRNMKLCLGNRLYEKAMTATKSWKFQIQADLKQKNKRQTYTLNHFNELTPEATIVFLENLLEEPKISLHTLKLLSQEYKFSLANAEVQHRWFELVVKFKFTAEYNNLKIFLTEHLAMGVYLFGEMLFSNDLKLQSMAKEVYLSLKSDMEPNYISTIEQMLSNSST